MMLRLLSAIAAHILLIFIVAVLLPLFFLVAMFALVKQTFSRREVRA